MTPALPHTRHLPPSRANTTLAASSSNLRMTDGVNPWWVDAVTLLGDLTRLTGLGLAGFIVVFALLCNLLPMRALVFVFILARASGVFRVKGVFFIERVLRGDGVVPVGAIGWLERADF